MTDQASPFSQDAISTNQGGRLTDEQSRLWHQIARYRRQSLRGVAYVFAAMGAFLLLANGSPVNAAKRTRGGLMSLAVASILVVAGYLEPVNADVREGRVESVEGAIGKRVVQVHAPPGSARFYFDVAGRRLQAMPRAYAAAPEAGFVRVYFLPRSRRVVNLEQLPDPQIATGPGAAKQIFANYANALLKHDRTALDEASAHVAALEHAVEGPPPSSNERGGRTAPHRLDADELHGTWTNPLLTITLMKNGVATMTTALDGVRREGRWSIDANGRLLTNATGTLEPIEASLQGNQLTIVIEGKRVAFTRVA